MVTHIVMFTWIAGVTPVQGTAFAQAASDKAGWKAYQAHPAHQAFVRDFVAPLQASRLTIQF